MSVLPLDIPNHCKDPALCRVENKCALECWRADYASGGDNADSVREMYRDEQDGEINPHGTCMHGHRNCNPCSDQPPAQTKCGDECE